MMNDVEIESDKLFILDEMHDWLVRKIEDYEELKVLAENIAEEQIESQAYWMVFTFQLMLDYIVCLHQREYFKEACHPPTKKHPKVSDFPKKTSSADKYQESSND